MNNYHFVFHMRRVKEVQKSFAAALVKGAANHGDTIIVKEGFDGVDHSATGAIVFGVGGGTGPLGARTVFDAYKAAGSRVIFFDKGYTRHDVFRVAIDAFQPSAYLMDIDWPMDRKAGLQPQPYSTAGRPILFDGASQKYCAFMRLGDQLDWGEKVIHRIRDFSDRPIIWRPRPSHNYLNEEYTLALRKRAQQLAVELSTGALEPDLKRAGLVVSHGGNIGFDAALSGRANFIIEDSIVAEISENIWQFLDAPYVPEDGQRLAWLANVMYCQWSLEELSDGSAWRVIRQQLELARLAYTGREGGRLA